MTMGIFHYFVRTLYVENEHMHGNQYISWGYSECQCGIVARSCGVENYISIYNP